MCYGSNCKYEACSTGECYKPEHEPCPHTQPENYLIILKNYLLCFKMSKITQKELKKFKNDICIYKKSIDLKKINFSYINIYYIS